jgi:hypothetical protein
MSVGRELKMRGLKVENEQLKSHIKRLASELSQFKI